MKNSKTRRKRPSSMILSFILGLLLLAFANQIDSAGSNNDKQNHELNTDQHPFRLSTELRSEQLQWATEDEHGQRRPKIYPFDLKRPTGSLVNQSADAHHIYYHSLRRRSPHWQDLEPRQGVVIVTTSYPGTDTVYATKTVYVNQPTPDSNGIIYVDPGQPTQPTPVVVVANNRYTGSYSPPPSIPHPGIIVATVTVFSSATRVKLSDGLQTCFSVLQINIVIFSFISIGFGFIHLSF